MNKLDSIIVTALEELKTAPSMVHYTIHSPSVFEDEDGTIFHNEWVFQATFVTDTGNGFERVVAADETFEDALVAFLDAVADFVGEPDE